MTKIKDYPAVSDVAANDLLLGTRTADGATVNFPFNVLSNACRAATIAWLVESAPALANPADPANRVFGADSTGFGSYTLAQLAAIFGGSGGVQSIVAGANITVDNTDPANPVVSATGGGGGGTVRNWDLTKVVSPAVLALATFAPTFPYPNDGTVAAPLLSLSIPAGSPKVGGGSLGFLPSTGKVFWYWQPLAATGTYAFAQNGVGAGPLDAPAFQFGIVAGEGLKELTTNTVIDAAFVDGDVALVYADVDTGAVGVKTPHGDFPAAFTGATLPGLEVLAGVFGYVTTGTGTLSSNSAVTDLGSGLTPPVGYSGLTTLGDAPLPAGSVVGDSLTVTVAGSWANIPYNVGDGATVAATSPAAVTPTGATSASVAAAVAQKITKSAYLGMSVQVGTGKTFATLAALRDYIIGNALSGPLLLIDLYPGATTGSGSVDLWFPTFLEVLFQAGASSSGSYDFGAASVTVHGSPSNTYFFGDMTLSTTNYFNAEYAVFGGGVLNCQTLKLRNWYGNGTVFNLSDIAQPDIGDGNLFGLSSTITLNCAPGSLGALITGANRFLHLVSNAPVNYAVGTMERLWFTYTGGNVAGNLITVTDCGRFNIDQVDCGSANIGVVVAVARGGIASVNPLTITGTGTIGANFNQAVNVPTANGLIMA